MHHILLDKQTYLINEYQIAKHEVYTDFYWFPLRGMQDTHRSNTPNTKHGLLTAFEFFAYAEIHSLWTLFQILCTSTNTSWCFMYKPAEPNQWLCCSCRMGSQPQSSLNWVRDMKSYLHIALKLQVMRASMKVKQLSLSHNWHPRQLPLHSRCFYSLTPF